MKTCSLGPVALTIYGQSLEGFSPIWIGFAIGAYGLTQAVLQIPMGRLSDKIGRKKVIVGGLLVFALGSVIAALAESIQMVTVGRALQGMGAIASALLAFASDLSRDEQRPKVMAVQQKSCSHLRHKRIRCLCRYYYGVGEWLMISLRPLAFSPPSALFTQKALLHA